MTQSLNGMTPNLDPSCRLPHRRIVFGTLAMLGVSFALGTTALAQVIINSPPTSQTVCAPSPATFTVDAKGRLTAAGRRRITRPSGRRRHRAPVGVEIEPVEREATRLRLELRRTEPGAVAELHGRAAAWLEEHGLVADAILDVTLKMRRKPWVAAGLASGLIVIAVTASVFLRRGPAAVPSIPTNTSRPAPPPEAQTIEPPKAPLVVRMRLDSTPPGARVVRVSDGVVLGTTPETIELRPSNEPLPLRFEKEGFVAAMREASLAADSSLSVVLEAAERTAPTPKKHTPGKSHSSAGTNEPAKL